ncbi:MAG: zinc ABC transporter substrate-binding protein [Bacteroidota bacterium]
MPSLLPKRNHYSFFTFPLIVGVFPLVYFVLTHTRSTSQREEGKLLVVATTGMIGDAVSRIAEDSVTLKTLMGPGVDPHSYELSIQDGDLLMEADVVFYNGLHLEGAMHEPFEKMKSRADKEIYAAGDVLSDDNIIKDEGFDTGQDPHIFHSVRLWIRSVRYIGEKLILLDPKNAAFYRANMEVYLAELKALDKEIEEAIKKIPEAQRYLITAHDAFGYYGQRYGLTVKSLQGISTATEPSLRNREDLKNFIIEHQIKMIFSEASVPQKGIQAVIESCEKEGYVVDASKQLYSDALGDRAGNAGTYVGMLRTNTQYIVAAYEDYTVKEKGKRKANSAPNTIKKVIRRKKKAKTISHA